MNHPHPDELLLLASGEVPDGRVNDVVTHVDACPACQATLAQLDQSLSALGGSWPRRSRRLARTVWGGLALAAAATLAVVFARAPQDTVRGTRWTPTTTWSATAGYVSGGKEMMDIDAQLTRLEQETHYARP